MIFADKLIRLRKKSGMSQEEFAEKMSVSRQAVSKWEGAQSVPDLERILKISEMFGVTMDYLLKDDIEDEEFSAEDYSDKTRKVTLGQANEYLALRRRAAPRMALATFMCIVSFIPLLMLGGLSEYGKPPIDENLAGGLGMIFLLIIAAAAVGIYLHTHFQSSPYRFLEDEPFETEYGVLGMVREQQKAFRGTYVKMNIIGVCLCILAVVPLFVGAALQNDLLMVILLNVLIFMVAIAVFIFVLAGVRWGSMEKLLGEGDFSEEKKSRRRLSGAISGIYWSVAVAVYLAWLFLENVPEKRDSRAWVVFPVAGVLYAAVLGIARMIEKRRN